MVFQIGNDVGASLTLPEIKDTSGGSCGERKYTLVPMGSFVSLSGEVLVVKTVYAEDVGSYKA